MAVKKNKGYKPGADWLPGETSDYTPELSIFGDKKSGLDEEIKDASRLDQISDGLSDGLDSLMNSVINTSKYLNDRISKLDNRRKSIKDPLEGVFENRGYTGGIPKRVSESQYGNPEGYVSLNRNSAGVESQQGNPEDELGSILNHGLGNINPEESGEGGKYATSTGPSTEEKKEEQPQEPEKSLEELLEEMDSLVGLDTVKADVHALMDFIQISKMREDRGFKTPDMSYHLVFTGNPGTGKTTIARLVAKLYKQIGILKTGQLVEADRSSLVAGYVGQTAIQTKKIIEQAMGGVLFIDEAYALANDDKDAYGKEAIETLLKSMEDHRDELVVIVAGYDDLMHKFIDSNPGLQSRFSKYFQFPDYTGEEMKKIFDRYLKSNGYMISEETGAKCLEIFNELYEERDENFGNARTVRNVFEKAVNIQASRLVRILKDPEKNDLTDDELKEISQEDIWDAYVQYRNQVM